MWISFPKISARASPNSDFTDRDPIAAVSPNEIRNSRPFAELLNATKTRSSSASRKKT